MSLLGWVLRRWWWVSVLAELLQWWSVCVVMVERLVHLDLAQPRA